MSLIASFLAMTFATAPALAPVTPTLAAPQIVDPALIPGTAFTADFTISNVEEMLGYQIWLKWDPTIIKATAASTEYPFTYGWGDSPKIEEGYLYMVFSYPLPELTGFYGDLAIAHVTFEVVDYGVSALELYNTIIVHISNPDGIPHTVQSGVFSNIPQTGVHVFYTGYFLRYRVLKGNIQTATTQLESDGTATTKAKAKWVVFDALGGVVATAESTTTIMPGQVLRLSADFDTTTWERPASYTVEYTVEYLTFNGSTGEWVLATHGGSAKTSRIKTFILL